jgi:hypothetical protein
MIYAKIAVAIAVILAAYGKGWYDEHQRFLKFQAEVDAIGKAQELVNQNAIEMAGVITESVKDEYETRIAGIKSEYARRMRQANSGSCPMPSVSKPAKSANGNTDDIGIIGACAVETAKLVALQKWISKQQEVTNRGQ